MGRTCESEEPLFLQLEGKKGQDGEKGWAVMEGVEEGIKGTRAVSAE